MARSGLRVVLCGPPHSGKSVFCALLGRELRRRGADFIILRCAPDGEGTWSQESDQEVVTALRRKGTFSNNWVTWCERAVEASSTRLVLVDVGGRMSAENRRIMSAADAAVVISSPEERAAWESFAAACGLNVLAALDSALQGEESVEMDRPVARGRVVGLERGRAYSGRWVGAVADLLWPKEGETRMKHTLSVQCASSPRTGTEANVVTFTLGGDGIVAPEELQELQEHARQLPVDARLPVVIDGRMPLWLAVSLAHAAGHTAVCAAVNDRRLGWVVAMSHSPAYRVGQVL